MFSHYFILHFRYFLSFITGMIFTFQAFSAVPGDQVLSGQYIVEVTSDETIRHFFIQNISDPDFHDLSIEKLMDKPFCLWLIKTDPYNDHLPLLEKRLRTHTGVLRFFRNRTIQVRKSPDDPLFSNQWQLENTGQSGGLLGADMDILEAWDISEGGLTYSGDTIVVAVLDDGINGRHPDMVDNMWINYHEIPDNGLDDDDNGYVDDYYGWDVTLNNDDVYSGGGHGTPVAGIIGARGNNTVGVSGVNWYIKIMPVNYGEATEARALASYGYVYTMRKLYNETHGQKGAFIAVTNASWGIDGVFSDEASLWCDLYDALGSLGILNVAATSNSQVDVDEVGDMPSTCESEFLVIATNVNRQDALHGSSAYGRKSVDIGAFGHQVYTVSRNSYGSFGGTSGASPHVAGLAALLYSAPCYALDSLTHADPATSVLVIRDMLLSGAEPNVSLENITSSGGRVNAYRAMSNVMDLCSPCSVPAGITLHPTDTSVVIQWPWDSGSPVSVRYKKPDELSWTIIDNLFNGGELKNLNFCTEYEIQWSTTCGFLPGMFGYSKFFRTEGCCQLPDEVRAEILPGSVRIELNHSQNAWYRWVYTIDNEEVRDTITEDKYIQWSGLDECQTIRFTVQSQCLKNSNTSEISENYIHSTPCGSCTENNYCQFGRKTNSQEWIRRFQLGSFINESDSEPNGYTHFLGLQKIKLSQGAMYDYEVEVGYLNDAYSEYLKMYIDFNQDGSFDAGEEVSSVGPLTDVFKGRILIPESAAEGFTLMRVILTYDNFDGACDTSLFEFGEVEDYCVFIEKGCPDVIQWVISEKTTSGITFQVSEMPESADSLKLDIREAGTVEWDSYYWVDSVHVQNLKSCQEYEYRIYSVCGNIFSAGAPMDTTKTLCSNGTEDVSLPFRIYPNPATHVLFMEGDPEASRIHRIDIRSMDGQLWETEFVPSEIENRWQVDVSLWPSGMYILTVYSSEGVLTPVRFVITHH